MESSYKRFNNIGEEEVNPSKMVKGSDPLHFGTTSDQSYFTTTNVPTENVLRPAQLPPQLKRNNDDTSSHQNLGIQKHQRLRLRALETETEYFLRLLNVTTIKRLLWVQITAWAVIFMAQVLLYAITTGYGSFKVVDYSGIGIWAPAFIFSVAAGLSIIALKSPTGCILGAAMGFQIASAWFASVLMLLASVSLMMHGRWDYHNEKYDPEIGGRIVCSFMIFGSVMMVISCIFISVQFCRVTCCGRAKATEAFLFDVETVKA